MARIVFIIIVTWFGLSISDICDHYYPLNDAESCNSWDKLKHQLYLGFAGACAFIASFKESPKYWISMFASGALSGLVMGVIPQMIMEKNQNRFLPHDWKDYMLLAVSCIPGLIYTYFEHRLCKTKEK